MFLVDKTLMGIQSSRYFKIFLGSQQAPSFHSLQDHPQVGENLELFVDYCMNQDKAYRIFTQKHVHSTYNSFANLLIFTMDLLNVSRENIFIVKYIKDTTGNEKASPTFFPYPTSYLSQRQSFFFCFCVWFFNLCTYNHLHEYLLYINNIIFYILV